MRTWASSSGWARASTASLAGDLVFTYQPHCEWVVADADAVVVLPALPTRAAASSCANLNTAFNGVLDTHPALGDVVVASGLGVVGLLVTRLLRRAGVATS